MAGANPTHADEKYYQLITCVAYVRLILVSAAGRQLPHLNLFLPSISCVSGAAGEARQLAAIETGMGFSP